MCKSLRVLAEELKAKGHAISHVVVGELLKVRGISSQGNGKVVEGIQSPDRNEQFESINATVATARAAGQPVISVDTKKKDLVGLFKALATNWALHQVGCCRKVVGWAFGQRQTADLVINALNMALQTRKPQDVIHHSNQGSQYIRVEFGKRFADMGVRPSMSSVGDAYDNAMAESFLASLECELIERRSWKTFAEARMAIFAWIEG